MRVVLDLYLEYLVWEGEMGVGGWTYEISVAVVPGPVNVWVAIVSPMIVVVVVETKKFVCTVVVVTEVGIRDVDVDVSGFW